MTRLLAAGQRRRRTRRRRRALGCFRSAVLVLRWFIDGTRLVQLAVDNRIGRSPAYRYLHEGIDALAAAAPAPGGRDAFPQGVAGHPRGDLPPTAAGLVRAAVEGGRRAQMNRTG